MGGKVLDYEAKDILNKGKAEGRVEGRAEGRAESILELLQELGTVSDELKERIMAEADIEQLKRWIKLAARSLNVDEFMNKMNQ